MKRLVYCIVVVIVAIGFSGCGHRNLTPEEVIEEHNKYQAYLQNDCEIYELTFNGETHEFVKWHNHGGQCAVGGLCHWPGCKYCKEKNSNNEEDNWLFK